MTCKIRLVTLMKQDNLIYYLIYQDFFRQEVSQEVSSLFDEITILLLKIRDDVGDRELTNSRNSE